MAASGSPGTIKEAARGLGPGPWPCPAPWARTLAASFAVPGDPEAATGSPVFAYGSQVANFENCSVVDFFESLTKGNKIDMAICALLVCLGDYASMLRIEATRHGGQNIRGVVTAGVHPCL